MRRGEWVTRGAEETYYVALAFSCLFAATQSPARAGVPDLRGEEFEEAIRGARAGGIDKGRRVRGNGGGELVHRYCVPTKFIQAPDFVSRTPASPSLTTNSNSGPSGNSKPCR
jgi:hypothetical protein